MPITSAAPTAVAIARHFFRVTHHVQRRHLFNLPDLSSFSASLPGSVQPQSYYEQKILPYTRQQLYAVVSDVGSYASFLPFCTHSRVLTPLTPAPTRTTPNAQRMEAELTVAFLAFTEQYTSRVTCVPCQSVRAVAASATPLFKTLETTWRFRPASPQCTTSAAPQPGSTGLSTHSDDVGPTLLSLDLSFAFASPIHAAVSGAFFGKVSTLMVKAFEERCLKVYGRVDALDL